MSELPMLQFNESSRCTQGVLHCNWRRDLAYTEHCEHEFLRSTYNHRLSVECPLVQDDDKKLKCKWTESVTSKLRCMG